MALEGTVYFALGVWFRTGHGWAAGRIAALFVSVAVGWRIAFALATYFVAWLHRSPKPPAFRLSALRMIPHIAAEVGAMVAVFSILQPLERLVMGDRRPPGPSRRLPVLLIHGYACNRAVAWSLARRLRARGETVWPITIEPVYGSIDDCAKALGTAIERLCQATGSPRVCVVTHSMGGLTSRAYLRHHGGGAIARLVTLGAPHHGSAHAILGAGQNAREMTPGSPWLAALANDERAFPAPFTSIFSHHDNLVAPQTSSVHAAAQNVPLAGIGHLALLFSPRVAELVGAELDAANGGPPAARP